MNTRLTAPRLIRGTNVKGFTLIELLVVIAIIAILAAILFPVFAQAREKARQTACLSNTKQMSLGIMQYTNDYDETLPVQGDNAEKRGRWFFQIYPYVKNVDVFTCPNLPSARLTASGLQVNSPSAQSGYGWNSAFGHGPDYPQYASDPNNKPDSGVPLATIAKPAGTIIVGDVGIDSSVPASSLGGYIMFARDPRKNLAHVNPNYYAQFRHNTTKNVTVTAYGTTLVWPIEGRCNFSFLDGHSKSLDTSTAFETAKVGASGFPEEDGHVLQSTTGPGEGVQATDGSINSGYVLWNQY